MIDGVTVIIATVIRSFRLPLWPEDHRTPVYPDMTVPPFDRFRGIGPFSVYSLEIRRPWTVHVFVIT